MASQRPWIKSGLSDCGRRSNDPLGQSGEVAIARVNPTKFETLNREQLIGGKCWTMPVLSNGKLYLRNARGDLICADLSK